MYLEHFGLAEEPFAVTSDPRYLYLSQSHEEALAHLVYCVEYRKGFAAITGEVGTGKTTLLNTLLTRLGKQHSVAFVYQSATSTLELLGHVFKDLRLPAPNGGKAEWLAALNEFLLAEHEAGRECVLIVDEAQNLGVDVLEDLRLISNFETPTHKLVQIILAGQTELAALLRRPEMRQLNQRISIQYQLKPLDEAETLRYVQHRLKTAGASRVDIFKPDALKAIHRFSGGIPRLINQVCDTALLRGALQRDQVISAALVRQVLGEDFQHRGRAHLQGVEKSAPERPAGFRVPRWAGAVALLGLGLLAGWGMRQFQERQGLPELVDAQETARQAGVKPTPIAPASASPTLNPASAQPAAAITDKPAHIEPTTTSSPAQSMPTTPDDSPAAIQHAERGKPIIMDVRPGDRLSLLARRVYGFVTWELMAEVVKRNPEVRNPNQILAGRQLVMPALDDSTLRRVRRGQAL